MLFKRPEILYPTVARGFIYGPVRYQSIDGSEFYEDHPEDYLTRFINYKPIAKDGKEYCVSHIQKKSPHFSLLYSPTIYHFGYFWKLQEYSQNPDGGFSWKPGTERGLYFRTCGFRWQIPDAKSEGTPWIFSWGRAPGMHLD